MTMWLQVGEDLTPFLPARPIVKASCARKVKSLGLPFTARGENIPNVG
jgi:hypothetical protein